MKIAVGSDMKTNLTGVVVAELKRRGYLVDLYGALSDDNPQWSRVAIDVAQRVSKGEYAQAILFCWTGTGISLAANKVRGVRCALCGDAETARGARLWNDANILAISLRATSEEVANEMLEAWFMNSPSQDAEDMACLKFLEAYESEHLPPVS